MNAHNNPLFPLLFLLSLSPSAAAPATDSQKLVSFKNSLPNPDSLPTWQPSTSPCNFHGVLCDKNSRVSSVDLSDRRIDTDLRTVATSLLSLPNLATLILKNATISGPIASLSRFPCTPLLTALDLSENSISGPVSDIPSLGVCSGLTSLNLSANSMGPPVSSRPPLSGFPSLQTLDLSFNNISGESSVSWFFSGGFFPGLQRLSLKSTKISGGLPALFNLNNLAYLDLSVNNISTNIPSFSGCSNLRHLDLSSNNFHGDFSGSLSACGNLSFVNLTSNRLAGPFPSRMPGTIQFLYLQENDFQGLFPASLAGLCPTLVELDLSYNNFTGALPESLGSCSGLELLDVTANNFSGEFPVEIFSKMSSLKTLALSFNNFVGGLSDSLSNLVSLETLDVSSNNISGFIPYGLCQDPRNSLKVLYLQNNMFVGPIPDSLSNCSNLESLDLSFNYLTGTIPSTFGSLTKLRDIIMWLNQLRGQIPEELMNLGNLENLILDFNDLTGSIPGSLSNCSKLNWISLSNNLLSGEIPSSLGQLTNLAILKLGNNSLSGPIPSELGDCRSLLWLDLNTNYLNGTIPPGLFKQSGNIAAAVLTGKSYVYIKNDGSKACHGAGNLLEFGGIRQEQLNRISTRHPCNFTRVYKGITQPTFSHNGSMILLDVSHNNLQGSIPKELGSMFYLFILNMGHNVLSGPIPSELGGLKNVAILDLSYNSFSGTIPQSLTGLTMLGEIDMSNNKLSGMIPQSAPFDTFKETQFANNSGLCGYPLPTCAVVSGSGVRPGPKSQRGRASLAGSVTMALLFSLFCLVSFVIVAVETRKRRKKKEAALEAYMDNHSNNHNSNTTTKMTMSINLETFEKPLKNLTFGDLLEATNGFHPETLVGSGGFGDVHKAKLKDGIIVAIKKLIHVSGQGEREFMNEMETIGKIKHRNLVPLLGYCRAGDERILVYEYMKYGSLEDVLHKKIGVKLSWAARRKIAMGAARGLAFLHHTCFPHILHRDMKSSNVLIDKDLEARVSDFGMARLMSAADTHLSVSTLAGTPGYVPPEYYQNFQCTTKGDVYSFGVVLLELLTGRKPTGSEEFGEDNNLVGWVKGRRKMSEVFDRELVREEAGVEAEMGRYLKVALGCLEERGSRRPTMVQVMAMFKEIEVGAVGMTIKEGSEEGATR